MLMLMLYTWLCRLHGSSVLGGDTSSTRERSTRSDE